MVKRRTKPNVMSDIITEAVEAYENGTPIMSDAEFDALTEEGPLGTKGKVEHEKLMLSQGKIHSYDEVDRFVLSTSDSLYTVSAKIDGFACSLIYEYGELVMASTRGDGKFGEDITASVKSYVNNVESLNERLVPFPHVEIRGEIYMPMSEYKKLNTTVSSRNIAVGMCKRKEENITQSEVFLNFAAWDIVAPEFDSEMDKYSWAQKYWIPWVPIHIASAAGVKAVVRDIEEKRSNLGMECDGVVIKCNSVEKQAELGATKHHPKSSIAYKFASPTSTATVLKIRMTKGKTGKVTPVATITPTQVGGATVTKVSLGSEDVMHSLGVTEGCRVEIERSGGVIPHIVKVI